VRKSEPSRGQHKISSKEDRTEPDAIMQITPVVEITDSAYLELAIGQSRTQSILNGLRGGRNSRKKAGVAENKELFTLAFKAVTIKLRYHARGQTIWMSQ
jgi:hypothetical protein